MTYRDTSADITLDNANMATKEQIAKLMADDPATIAERLSGNYVYPGAVSPMRTPPIEQEAGREIVRLRTEIDALKAERDHVYSLLRGRTPAQCDLLSLEIQALKAENERLKVDAERYAWLRNRDLDTISLGGVFAGLTPHNVVVNGDDLDRLIDAAMKNFSTRQKEER